MASYLEGEGVEGKSEAESKSEKREKRRLRKSAKKGRRTVLVMTRRTSLTHSLSLSLFWQKGEKRGRGGTSEPHSLKRDILQYRLNTHAALLKGNDHTKCEVKAGSVQASEQTDRR